jgi:mono/diheme cytochrome c family protein
MGEAMRNSVTVGVTALLALFATEALAADFPWQAAGADTYATVCAACHQPDGKGVPDTFPPLAGHAPTILARPGGRDYLIRLVLYGMEGAITANGKHFEGAMPPWGEVLTDDQIAGALDHALSAWDNDKALPSGFQPILPAEVAAARPTKMTAAEVYALRQRTMPAEAAPAAIVAPALVSFTAEQAGRGQTAYRRGCQDCHGSNLNDGEFGGAPLNGQYFSRHWGSGSAAALYGFVRVKMPPDRPGKLNPQTYADLIAFLLSKNGYQPGAAELPPDPDALEHLSLKR